MGAVTFFWQDRFVTCETLLADGWVIGRSKSGKLSDLGVPFPRIDAALKDPDDTHHAAYLFSGTSYAALNIGLKTCDPGVFGVAKWGGRGGHDLTSLVSSRLQAAANHPSSPTVSYFFAGGSYVRYDWPTDDCVGGVRSILAGWKLPEKFRGADLRGGVKTSAKGVPFTFFFSGKEFVRFCWNPAPTGQTWGTALSIETLKVKFDDGTPLVEIDAVMEGWLGPTVGSTVSAAPTLPGVAAVAPVVKLYNANLVEVSQVFPALLDEAFDPLGDPTPSDADLKAKWIAHAGVPKQSGLMRQGLTAATNWVDKDSRSFRIGIRDPGASGKPSITASWECFAADGTKVPRPEPKGIIELAASASDPTFFVSPGLVVTTVDYHVGLGTYALLTTKGAGPGGTSPAGLLDASQAGYRVRLFSITGKTGVEYPVGSKRWTYWESFPTTGDPSIRRKNLNLTFFVLWNADLEKAYAPRTQADVQSWILGAEARHLRGVFERIGITVSITGNAVTFVAPPAGYLPAGGLSREDRSRDAQGNFVLDSNGRPISDGSLVLGPLQPIAHPNGADAGSIAIVYANQFGSGAGGWGGDANANLLAVALNNFGFSDYGSAIAHEIGHCLTVQDVAKLDVRIPDPADPTKTVSADPDRIAHYPRDRSGPRDERLHLVAAGWVTGAIAGTLLNIECIWDANDSRGYNWFTGMRSSGLLKG